MNNYPKDPILNLKSFKLGKTKKTDQHNPQGQDHVGFAFKPEDVTELMKTLTTLKDSPRGIKFDVYNRKKEHDGRIFDSAFVVLRAVQDPPGATGTTGTTRTTVDTVFSPEQIAAAVAALNAQKAS